MVLLAKRTSELFSCHKYLKTQFFFACLLSYNKWIVQISQVFKTQFFAYLLSYNKWIVQISQASKTQFFAYLLSCNKWIVQMWQASKAQFFTYLFALLFDRPCF